MGLGVSGRLYVGVNLEFAQLPVNNSVHAEQFLVVNAVHHGERAITKMAVSAAPCGHCRQFYSELCCAVSLGACAEPKEGNGMSRPLLACTTSLLTLVIACPYVLA